MPILILAYIFTKIETHKYYKVLPKKPSTCKVMKKKKKKKRAVPFLIRSTELPKTNNICYWPRSQSENYV